MTGTSDKGNNSVGFIVAGVAGAVIGGLITFAVLQMGSGGEADPVVAKLNGQSVKASEVLDSIKTRLFDLEDEMFRLKERAILDYVEQKLLDDESKKQNNASSHNFTVFKGAPLRLKKQ